MMRHLRLGIVVPAYVCAPLWVAQREGYVRAADLDIHVQSLGSTHAVTQALEAGVIDVALATPEGSIMNALGGGPLRVIAGWVNKPPLTMIAQRRYTSLAQLRGARLGTTSLREGTRHLIEIMLAQAGLHYPHDYSFVMAGAHPQRWEALKEGSIDAAIQMVPFDYIAEEAGFSCLGAVHVAVPDFAFCTVNTRLDYAVPNRDAVVALLRVMRAGMQTTFADPATAVEAILAELATKKRHARRALESFTADSILSENLSIGHAAFAGTVESMRTSGDIASTAVALDDVCAFDYMRAATLEYRG